VFNLATNCNYLYLVFHAGYGLELTTLLQRFGILNMRTLSKGTLVAVCTWHVTACLSKLSVLLMYTSIIPNASMRVICRYFGATIVVWTVADLIAVLSICRPFNMAWINADKCPNQTLFYFIMGLLNLIIDTIIIALPMPYLIRLRTSWRKKIVAIILLGMGIVYVYQTDFHRLQYANMNPRTWAITIYRQKCLWGLNWRKVNRYSDMAIAMFLGGLECAVMIVVACIPLMRPLFSRSKAHSPPNHGNNLNEGAHLEKGNKKAPAKLPRLLDPPSWFDNEDDVDAQVELQAKKDAQVTDAVSSSSSDISRAPGAPKDTVVDRKIWAAPVCWHAPEECRKQGLHEPPNVHADAL